MQHLTSFFSYDRRVTGMDTSAVDVISDIINLCDRNGCKLFVSGASPNLRSVLAHAGVKPLGGDRSKRKLRFFNSMDVAIGKAEDNLLDIQLHEKEMSSRKLPSLVEESGFQIALRYIDEQVLLLALSLRVPACLLSCLPMLMTRYFVSAWYELCKRFGCARRLYRTHRIGARGITLRLAFAA